MRLQEVQQHTKGSIELTGSEPAEKPVTWHSSAEQTGSGSGEGKQGIEPDNWPSQEKVAGKAASGNGAETAGKTRKDEPESFHS